MILPTKFESDPREKKSSQSGYYNVMVMILLTNPDIQSWKEG